MRHEGRDLASAGRRHHQMDQIHGEIGEILLGKKPGREHDDEITIFDSTGMAIQDNTTASRIYRNALERGVGTFFEFFS
jgi:alanine dehydrogenase